MKKDLFGYETQGQKYDLYRPKYPPKLLNSILQRVKSKNKYLDVATGTGQILFQIAHHFKFSKGLDISQKMIDVCKQKAHQKNINNIDFSCEDFVDSKMQDKFDLITIGQALHWLPIKSFLQKSKSLLTPTGILGVYGYILNGVQGETQQETKKLQQLYQQFYDKKVKKNFDFDRDELHRHYTDKNRYPFNEIFPRVHHQIVKVPIAMDKNSFICYLKTFSGYNTYLQRFPNQQNPIIQLEKQISEDSKLICSFDYFCIACQLDH